MAAEASLLPPEDVAGRQMARRHLLDFATYTKPDYDLNWFGIELLEVCEQWFRDCLAGKEPRLMIFAPPRHGKSETVSRRLPAWGLGIAPDFNFVGASYSPDLALSMSRDVKGIIRSDQYAEVFGVKNPYDVFEEPEPGVWLPDPGRSGPDGEKTADTWWQIPGANGSYRARGVGQPLSGFGANGLIIDDPVKDMDEARSPAARRKLWDWYRAVANLRIEPGGGILVMQTRWHEHDLAGLLLEQMEEGIGETFQVISYPALATEDEEHRKKGEALVPKRYDRKRLEKTRGISGSIIWSALFQQSPSVAGGDVFESEWWQYYGDGKAAPLKARIVYRLIFADTAQKTKERSDYSVFQCWGLGTDGRIYLLDQIRGKWKAPELLRKATAFWDKWAVPGKDHEVTRKIWIEDKVSGTGLIQQLESREHDTKGEAGAIPVGGIQRNTDKLIRADDTAPQIEAGNVVLPYSAPWLMDFLSEFSAFNREMTHPHDDQIDPLCDAVSLMLTKGSDLYAGAISEPRD